MSSATARARSSTRSTRPAHRRDTLEKRLFSGQVVASRELQAMNEEVKHLARHISELEDREIEIMEALEPLDQELSAGDVTRSALDADADRLRVAITTTEQALDAELAEENRARVAAASGVRGRPPGPLRAVAVQARRHRSGSARGWIVRRMPSGVVLDGARPRAQGAARRRDHLRAVRPDPGALTPPCSSSFVTVRARGTPPGSSSGDASRR